MLLSLILGGVAAVADIFGGLVLVRANWEKRYLRYSVALGAGFMLAVAFLEMLPESMHFSPKWAPILVLAGYCAIHLLEHTIVPHFHFGEETHHDEFISARTSYSVLAGLAVHALFDGVAIASGFVLSNLLGWLIFIAILLHKVPEGFTVASVMLASGRSRQAAVVATTVLATATLLGVNPDFVYFQTFFISGALAGAAGVLIGIAFNSVHFLMGDPYMLRAFVVIVLGGLGSIMGALIAGLLLGLVQTLTIAYVSSGLSDAIIFSILFVALLLRPTGFFGTLRKERRVARE